MRKSIAIKIIFDLTAAVSLLLFIGGFILIKIYKNVLAEFKIPEETAAAIINKNIIFLTIILVSLIIVLITAIYFSLKKIVINPIKKIQEGAETIAKGNLDNRINIEEKSGEIGQLAESFNEMTGKLKESYGGLERKIKERTEDVVKKVNDLEKMKTALYNILDDSKKINEEIEKEKDKLEIILSSIGEGLLVIDIDYKIKIINPVAEKLLEVKASEVIGRDARKIILMYKGDKPLSDDERPMAKMLKMMGTVVFSGLADDLYYQTLSGKKFPVDIIVSPLKNGADIIGAVVVFRDISELKKLDEAKTSFISIVSHQLRTPLTSIRWYAEMLESGDAGELNEQQKDFISRVYGGAMKLNEVINLLLSLARIESGRTEQELTKMNLVDFTNDALKGLEPLIKSKNLKTIFALEKSVEVTVDASKLRQVVVNLLSNSIRYTNNKGTIEIRIEERKKEKGGKEFVYSVRDDGIGIPEKQKEKIFMKFFRAENAVSKVPDGSGLGLALVKALVESWGGSAWFESQEGKGTTFYFTIPLL